MFERWWPLMSSKWLFFIEAMVLMLFLGFMVSCVGNAGNVAQTTQAVIPSSTLDDSSFYYYADGVRTQLTPSLKWISVKFVSADPAKQSAALQGTIVDSLGQVRRTPVPELTLLPLRKGLNTEALIDGINTLRADHSTFLQVDPVFQTGDAEMILTEEFIATFSAEKGKEEIDTINSSHGVEIVEPVLGQANTFVLKVTGKARLDVLLMANLYQESGLAVYAAPNFIRITHRTQN
jgi:hypothetical protein